MHQYMQAWAPYAESSSSASVHYPLPPLQVPDAHGSLILVLPII
uniref:Uncharacterized protein n=1 Tax=Picea glauca TaxID=3330 RepID=A0A117NGT1_PICGL|nr:hypothetical protein ABT39_MTgene5470 [Picea glauca]